MVADFGLKIITFQPFRDFEGIPEPQIRRDAGLDRDLLLIFSNVSPDALGGID